MLHTAISQDACENLGISALKQHEAGRKLMLQKAFPLATATPSHARTPQ